MVDVSSLNRSPFGINCHEASDEMLDRLADAGIRWFRFDVEWRAVQPRRDAFEWGTTERIVRWAGRRGVSLLAVMAYAPQWAWAAGEKKKDDIDQGQRPADSRDWRTFVETVVRTLGTSIQAYSIWNEANVRRFWHGDRDSYIETILKPGVDAVRRTNAGCAIVGPDLASSPKEGKPTDWLDAILASGVTFDVLTHHQYDGGNSVTGRMKLLDAIHDVCSSRGLGHLPFWVTEIGFRHPTETNTLETQASALEEVFREMWRRTWWRKTFWYDFEGPGWGLFDGNAPVPAFTRFVDIAQKARLGQARATRLAAVLGKRQPTDDEERRGMASYADGGLSRPLVDDVLATQEGSHFLAGLSADEAAFVLYEELLGRSREQIDAEGLQATIEAIAAGRLADRVAAVLDSPEFAEKFGNSEG